MVGESNRVVLIDTNFVGRGSFNAQELSRLAKQLVQRGHAIAIPDVVIWEWAQHANEALIELSMAAARAANRVDASLEVELLPAPLPSVDALDVRIRASVAKMDGVEVMESQPGHALTAIAQQVKQTGVGTRGKGGTKTGAADALIVHMVEWLLETHDQVVLATGDQLLGGAARDLDSRVEVVRDQRALWEWHGLTKPTTIDLVRDVTEFVTAQLVAERSEVDYFRLLDRGESLHPDILRSAGFTTFDVRQTDVTVEGFDEESVEIGDLEIVEGDEVPHLAVANVTVSATVSITNWFIGGVDAELLDEWATEEVEITTPLTIELDEQWQPIAFDADGAATLFLTEEW